MILTRNQGFQKVLKAEKLLDLSQFNSPELFDEVPLYSRYKQMSFLNGMSLERANESLLAMGLDLLMSIINNHSGSEAFFAALTVWQGEDDALIVPNIFICNNNPRRQLKKLTLQKAKAHFCKKIGKLVRKAAGTPQYLAVEDNQTLEDDIRVFIGPKTSPCAKLVTLRSLLE
jgi:hypothetical protein